MKNLPVRHENGETARYRRYKQRPEWNFFGGLLFFFSICYSRLELTEVCLR